MDAETIGRERQEQGQANIARSLSLPFAFDCRLNQILDDWRHIAVRYRRTISTRDGDSEREVFDKYVEDEIYYKSLRIQDLGFAATEIYEVCFGVKASQDYLRRWVIVPGIGG